MYLVHRSRGFKHVIVILGVGFGYVTLVVVSLEVDLDIHDCSIYL